jgi:DNA primase catalytic core
MNFDEIKRGTDIVRVVESYGVALKKAGKDHVGLCPFHEEKTPSFRVSPAKGLFHCMGCGAAGNVIQFVARKENLSDREAAQKLLGALPGVCRGSELPERVEEPAAFVFTPSELLAAAVEHYHQTLFGSDERGLKYLESRRLGDVETLRHFKVGFVNGSLKRKLSPAQIKALSALFNEKGNERFYLRVVVPIFDETGVPVGLYGRSIQAESEVPHLYLGGEHRAVWNGAAAAVHPDELIVTEAILDGLALFTAGKKNVIAAYGTGGWTPRHDALVQKHGVRKLVFAFDNDEKGQGDTAARELAQMLDARGIRCHRVKWPESVKDACDYFTYHREGDFRGTPESLAALVASAPRIGHARTAAPRLTLTERTDDSALFQNGSVSYRVKELGGGASRTGSVGMRVVLTARKETENGAAAAHVDNLDLYGARSRKGFATAAAERLDVEAQKIEEDLLALLGLLEALQEDREPAPTQGPPPMTTEEKEAAFDLLRAPDLLGRIAADLEVVGYVGEDRNKKLAYLIGTSRRLPKPLSGIFRAQSGCGKSFLMECVAEMMPPEDVHYFSRLTPQALYYMEADALAHKLLIVDERDGSEEAEYPIRTLQTRRVLKLAVPVKDPNSGKIKTSVLEIHGPIAYMESTTDQRINPENANRCFELYLDESEEQTRAIFAAQRRARTLEGWKDERRRGDVIRAHHNAQRLLRPLKVIIPFVDLIEFPAAWLRGRRDNDRLLSLIEGLAFLHQQQRQRHRDGASGDRVEGEDVPEYIEASLDDYEAAYDLAHVIFAQAGSDVPKPVADFLARVEAVVAEEARKQKAREGEVWFTRRMVREAVRLPDHVIKAHMSQIEELEYVHVQRAPQGGSYRYRLLPQKKAAPVLDGLTTPDALREKWKKWVKSGNRQKPPAEAHQH